MSSSGQLEGRTVLVTGGSMGIGYAVAEAVLSAGANVAIAARGEAALSEAYARLSRAGGNQRVLARICDVSVESDVDALIRSIEGQYGRLDGVVHAAAVIGPIGDVLELDSAAWLDAVRIDLFGSFLVARAAAHAFRRGGGGKLVLVSGGGGTTPFPRYSAYASSKAAVVRLAETLALELEPYGISVNALAPGFVATRMHDATLEAGAKAGEEYLERTRAQLAGGGVPPSLAADAAVFLLSTASDGITGRLLAAPWDNWGEWPARAKEIEASDLFTLRRIVPADRGLEWE